ncbi:sulfate adenylyltransferase subunit CysN [Endozoicomonas sp. (ex Bugula neritina AB1)]|nr:sulfate adenylyltransferase subunit CysN [Endozoicomonas sp. (ex Bugula neritina AB1)]
MSHQSELIASDIHAYLKQHENKELLKFLTCGSVDDGKSTLIGRLLHDSKMIYEDQLAEINADNQRAGNAGEHLDLALLVDGLQAEREQGITIDVAYRYFSTDKRKFIIADTPGHEQYTRNMATGASNCDLAIILIDARHGVQTQTKRHSFIVSLLGIKHTIIAINKMDLVDYRQDRYEEIKSDYLAFTSNLNMQDVQFIPISALKGDNVVKPSEKIPWHQSPLMSILESVNIRSGRRKSTLRFPVQYVNRPNQDFRGYAGTVSNGVVRPGDEVTVLPSGQSSKVKSITSYDGDLPEAFSPMSVTLTLEDEIDISRGDLLVHSDQIPESDTRFDATLVWLSETPLVPGKQYDIKLASRSSTGKVSRIHHQIDVNTLQKKSVQTLGLNGIARCELNLETPVVIDDYQDYQRTGSFILVDRLTNATVAAGMVHPDSLTKRAYDNVRMPESSLVTPEEKAARFGQRPALIILSGACEEIRTGLIYQLEKQLIDERHAVVVLKNEYSSEHHLASYLLEQGLIVLSHNSALKNHPDSLVVTVDSGNEYDVDLSSKKQSPIKHLVDFIRAHGVI